MLSTTAPSFGQGLKRPDVFSYKDANNFFWACKVKTPTTCSIMPYKEKNKPIGDVSIPGEVVWQSQNKKFTVDEIDPKAFEGCAGMTSVSIPESVVEIASWAFEGCSGLRRVRIPKKVSTIGMGVFRGCSALEAFEVEEGSAYFSASSDGVLMSKKQDVLVVYPPERKGDYVIPKSVKALAKHAFYSHSYLSGLTIPGSIENISDYMLTNCPALKRITILEGVKQIGMTVCDGCRQLESVYIPSSMKRIDRYAFTSCKGPVYWLPKAGECSVEKVAFGENERGDPVDRGVQGKILYVRKGTMDAFKSLAWVRETKFQVKEGCVVKFDAKGGSPASTEFMVAPGDRVTLRLTPTKDGFRFIGWRKVGETQPLDFDDYRVSEDITLEALWASEAPESYTLAVSTEGEGTIKVTRDDAHGAEVRNGDALKAGDRLFIVATPRGAEYVLKSLTVNGENHTNSTVYTVKAGGNVRVEAKFGVVKKQEDHKAPQTAVESMLLAGVRIVSNPVRDALVLEGLATADRVEVYSLGGARMAVVTLDGADRVTVATIGWASGVYVALVTARDGARGLRFVKR